MTNLPSHQRAAELAEQKSAPFATHEISRRDNYAAASAHRSMRWEKTSATGSPTKMKTQTLPGPMPPTKSSTASPHIVTEFLAQDAGA
jgi:hypothetical protein